MVPTKSPIPHAANPLNTLPPESEATTLKPNKVSIKSSAEENANTTGRATKINKLKMMAPTTPPIIEDKKAADSARAACPFFANGKPSITVA